MAIVTPDELFGKKEKRTPNKGIVTPYELFYDQKPINPAVTLPTASRIANPVDAVSASEKFVPKLTPTAQAMQRAEDELHAKQKKGGDPLIDTSPVAEKRKNLKSRKLPIIGPVYRLLDKVADFTAPAAEVGADLYTPGAGLANMASFAKGTEQALAKVAPKVALGKGAVAKTATEFTKEGVLGAPIAAVHSASQGKSNKEILQDSAIGVLSGGLGGGAFPAAKGIVDKIWYGKELPLKNAVDDFIRNVEQSTSVTHPEGRITQESTPKQGWFENLFGNQGVGIVPSAGKSKEMIDTHIVSRSKKPSALIQRAEELTSTTGQNFVDRFTPFKQINQRAYDAAMDSTRANNLANVTIKDKFVDLEGNVLGKSLKEVYENVPRGQKDLADRYIIMRDAVSRMDRGLRVYGDEPWFPQTADQAAKMVAELEARNPWLKQFGEDWNNFNRNRQDLWVQSGIASQELIDTLRHTNPNYAPMFRQKDNLSLKGKLAITSSKSGFSRQKAPVQRAVGSSKKIIEPTQGMIETTGSSYNAMMRNRAMQEIYEAVIENPERYKGIIEIVEESAEMRQATLKKINESLAENGPEGIADLLNHEIDSIFKKSKQSANSELVTVMVKGNPIKMRVHDASLLKAVEGISPQELSAIAKVLEPISRGIKYSATGGLAPLQGMKLAFRDLPIALAQSKDKKRFLLDVSHAIVSQIADWLPKYVPGAERIGNLARQYYRAGGGYEAYLKGDSKLRSMSADLTKNPILSGRNLVRTARKSNPFRPLNGFANAMENIPRIAAFKEHMRRTKWDRSPENVRKAVDAAREATVNWSRRGYKSAEIEAILPYSNAAVQGSYRFVKRLREQPISAIGLIMAIAGTKIAMHEKFKNDPDYQYRSRFEKGIPYEKTKDGKFRTIPIEPTESFVADQVLEFWKWANGEQSGQTPKQAVQEGAEAFLPKYLSGPVSAFTQPYKTFDSKALVSTTAGGSAFEPVTAVATGKNYFGSDIIPREYQDLPTDLQYNETTSAAGKWAAENLGIDAFTFDYLGQKFGGDIAKIGLPMTSEVGKGDPTGNIVGETLSRLKLLEDPVMKNQISKDFYRLSSKVSQAKAANTYKDEPLPDWYNRAYDEVTSQKKHSLASRISEFNSLKKQIQRDTTLNAKERAEQLREVQTQINLLRIQGIKRLEELGVK